MSDSSKAQNGDLKMHGVSFPGTNGGPSSRSSCERRLGNVKFFFNREAEIVFEDGDDLWEDLAKALKSAEHEAQQRVSAGRKPQYCLVQKTEQYTDYCTRTWTASEWGEGELYWDGIRVYDGVKIVAIEGKGDPIAYHPAPPAAS